MSAPANSRRRAVRLTPEALEILNAALVERWRGQSTDRKLTRAVRASLLGGISIATADKLLGGHGVDRTIATLAFTSLDLRWDDAYCVRVAKGDDDASSATPEEEDPEPAPSPGSAVEKSRAVPRFALIGALAMCFIAFGWWRSASAGGAPVKRWEHEFDAAFKTGTELYHRGDYAGGRKELGRALELARKHDSVAGVSGALRLWSDLASARGSLHEAREKYKEALSLRSTLKQDYTKPALWEALGALDTQLGNYASARYFLTKSFEGYGNLEDSVGVGMAARNLGTLAYRMGDLNEADRWFGTAMKRIAGEGKVDLEMDIRGRRALVVAERGRFDAARTELRQCLDHWMDRKHVRWTAVGRLHLGIAEAEAGNRAAATTLFRQSRSGFEEAGDLAGAKEANAHLKRIAAL